MVCPRERASVEDFCNRIHKGIIKQFKYALVWGTSVKHRPQKVGFKPGWAMLDAPALMTMQGY